MQLTWRRSAPVARWVGGQGHGQGARGARGAGVGPTEALQALPRREREGTDVQASRTTRSTTSCYLLDQNGQLLGSTGGQLQLDGSTTVGISTCARALQELWSDNTRPLDSVLESRMLLRAALSSTWKATAQPRTQAFLLQALQALQAMYHA
eukprot:3415185-Prymnesium_polylepis.1